MYARTDFNGIVNSNHGDNIFNGDPLDFFDWKENLYERFTKEKLKNVLNPKAVEPINLKQLYEKYDLGTLTDIEAMQINKFEEYQQKWYGKYDEAFGIFLQTTGQKVKAKLDAIIHNRNMGSKQQLLKCMEILDNEYCIQSDHVAATIQKLMYPPDNYMIQDHTLALAWCQHIEQINLDCQEFRRKFKFLFI